MKRPITNRNRAKGFTLLEAIIYIGLTGMVLVAMTLFSLEFTLTKSKSSALARANRYTQFASARINYEIQSASAVDYSNSVFDANPGTIYLETDDAATDPTIIAVTGNALTIKQGTEDAVALTPDDLAVTNFFIENVADTFRSRSIRYSLALSLVNPDSLEFSDADAGITTSIRTWLGDGLDIGVSE
jgi:type II secretory pathway pseudopilin PulG